MAIGATSNGVGYNELLSTTIQKLEGELVDQTMSAFPTLDIFKEMVSAGDGPSVHIPVRGSLLGKTAVATELGNFSSAADNDLVGTAQYSYSSPIITPTSVPFQTLALNEGSNRILDIMRVHIDAAVDDHAVALNDALWGSGAVNGAFNTIEEIVSATGTLGGIDPSGTATWWTASEHASASASEDIKVGFRKLQDAVSDASGKKGDVIICGSDVFAEYEESLDDQVRYGALGTGETRFTSLNFAGLELRRDPHAPADKAFLLNRSSWVVRNLRGHFMRANPEQQIPGTLSTVTPFSTILMVGTRERRANGVMTRS